MSSRQVQINNRDAQENRFHNCDLKRIVGQHVALWLGNSYQPSKSGSLDKTVQTHRPKKAELLVITESFMLSEPGAFMDTLERFGLSELDFGQFYRLVIEPVSVILGEMWCEDDAGFLGITIAIERLRLSVDTLFPDDNMMAHKAPHQVLLSCHQNDAHTFGAFLLAKAYTMNGWHVVNSVETKRPETYRHALSGLDQLAAHHFDVFALSVGSTLDPKSCREAIKQARKLSLNPDVVICLGGAAVALAPKLFQTSGADFVSSDALGAVEIATRAVKEKQLLTI